MNRRGVAEALAFFLLAALPGCGQRASGKGATPSALYPGADASAKAEHVFLYPLDEALAAAQAVLESHDFDVEPFKDETQLMTRWQPVGALSASAPALLPRTALASAAR